MAAFNTPPEKRTEELKVAVKLSDQLTEELLATDLLVISAPLWNFGVPSSLEAWIDHVVRAGKTFSYSATGPVGALTGKTAVIVASTGGVYSDGPMKAYDFAVPHLKSLLGFLGISDVQVVRVEGTAIPTMKEEAIRKAEKAVAGLRL